METDLDMYVDTVFLVFYQIDRVWRFVLGKLEPNGNN
jgi:hypothetical protein